MATMNSGLGGPAGYGENVFTTATKAAGGNDDGSVAIDTTPVFGANGINFFGNDYATIYLNTNGTISFGTTFTDWQTSDLTAETTPMLAPFFADVNLNRGGEIYWDVDTGAGTITMTWLEVQPYSGSGTNSFQVVLTSDGAGDFTVEYIYENIDWAGSGSDLADVGYTDGGDNDVLLDGSGNSAELLAYDTNDFQNGDPAGAYAISFADGIPQIPDGIVDGTDGADTIDAAYADDPDGDVIDGNDAPGTGGNEDLVYALGGDDSVAAGAGNDTIYGGNDDDTLDGGAGSDTIYGDNGGPQLASAESLSWSAQGGENTNLEGGFTQNTGDMDVTVSFDDGGDTEPLLRIESTDRTYTESGEPFSDTSNAYLYGDNGTTSVTSIAFSGAERSGYGDEVSNVQFRINDIDWGSGNHTDILTINAFDANGDPVAVTITPGGSDEVVGNTITAAAVAESQLQAGGSALITIAGPVSNIEILYSNGQSGTQAVWISDIHFTTIPPVDGNDSIDGGAGRDYIDGEGGDDTIDGGNSADTILGGAGNDVIVDSGGSGSADSIDGGTGNDSIDAGHGNDTLIGGEGDDTLTGNRGADVYDGGAGDDVMYLSEGDTADGGDGDDLFVLTDLGETGSSTISITGGEGDETDGDTLQLNSDVSYSDITFTNTDDNAGGLSGNFAMADGTVVTFTEIENIICFTPGVHILTEHGSRPIETLQVGDLIVTRDNGLQPIRWLGARRVAGLGRFAPVHIAQHVMPGATCPLLVSPQHRIVFSGYRAELLFGASEVLVSAKHLIDGVDVRQIEQTHVTYIHLMLDAHEVVFADGAATESFHAGDSGISALSNASRHEIFSIFPELRSNPNAHGRTARRCLKRREAQLLCSDARPLRAAA